MRTTLLGLSGFQRVVEQQRQREVEKSRERETVCIGVRVCVCVIVHPANKSTISNSNTSTVQRGTHWLALVQGHDVLKATKDLAPNRVFPCQSPAAAAANETNKEDVRVAIVRTAIVGHLERDRAIMGLQQGTVPSRNLLWRYMMENCESALSSLPATLAMFTLPVLWLRDPNSALSSTPVPPYPFPIGSPATERDRQTDRETDRETDRQTYVSVSLSVSFVWYLKTRIC